ncbi:DUF1077-domain-containing protein [Violaceomyces palustris]|uniref:DUF1077-domain-containing protein n=1 Tax=Violaceomyces palustris TaxID=1673888 RepID=A0ACD0P8H6_9BASI|nr:DUF1077-domain-containing protein [Violaceomyces palustris]
MSAQPLGAFSLNYGSSLGAVRSRSTEPTGYVDPSSSSSGSKNNNKSSSPSSANKVAVKRPDPSAIKLQKAWELATSPAKSLPMNAIMLYMSGGGVQIFSMMAVGMLITGPFKGLSGMQSSFSRYSSPDHSLLLPKLTFILCQLAGVALGLYKCFSMGLLPTESSDWLAWREIREPLEFTPTY